MNKIVGLAIAGAAVTGITATAIVKGRGGGASGSPSFSSLLVGGSLPTTYSKKYGGTYGKYLVSSGESSKEWWNQKYESVKTQIPSSKGFQKVNKGYGGDDQSLNRACEKAYVWNETPTGDEETQSDSPFDKAAIWNLCSDNRTRPKSISEYNFEPSEKFGIDKEEYKSTSGQFTVGESHPSSSQLASIKHPGNKWFWELKGEEFFSDPEIIKGTSFFGQHYQRNKSDNDKAKVIKEVCEQTYKQVEGQSEDGYADPDEIFKWCSFSGEYQSPS